MDVENLSGDSEKVKTDKAISGGLETTPELINLARDLDDETKDSIAALVLEEYQRDETSRLDWLSMHAKWLKLYYQRDTAINPPWQGSSEEGIPLLTEACNQFQSRAYKSFFPNRFPVTAIPVGKFESATLERADRVGKYMSWQLMVKDRQYKRDKAALLLGAGIHGSCFTKTYYDPLLRKNCVRNVRAEDLVVNHGIGPRRMDEIERKTEIIYMSVNQSRVYTQVGFFIQPAEAYIGTDARPTTETNQRAEGTARPLVEEDGTARVLEQHRLLDLDGDGIAEPYIAWVCEQSRKLLRLAIRYEADQMGVPTSGKIPVEYYTHYQFLPNPEGFYGLGLGFLLEKPNSGINKLLRQFIDAATLANAGNMSGFISSNLATNKGDMKIELGKFTKVEASSEDIQKGIKILNFTGPSPALAEAIQLLMSESKRLSTVTDVVTGDVDKVLQPTTVATLVDQSLQMFTSVQEFLLESWNDELLKLYKLNAKYLSDEEYAAIVGGQSGFMQIQVGREDFLPDLRVIPVADPRSGSMQQRQQKAQMLYQFATTNPLIMQNPLALLEVSKRFLQAMEVEDIDRILPGLEQLAMQQEMQQAMMAEQAGAMEEQAAGQNAAMQEQGLVQGVAEGLESASQPTPGPVG